MRRVRVVGIGCGGSDHLTVEAIAALNDVDVFVVADKSDDGDDPLLALRRQILDRHVVGPYEVVEVADPRRERGDPVLSRDGYGSAVVDWHEARAQAYEEVFAGLGPDATAGFLVWGDPAFYDSTIRVLERVIARGQVTFCYDVLPGISALQVLAARHRLVLNEVGSAITVTTGRRLREAVDAGADNLLVVLSSRLDAAALDGDWSIWWGGNLGTPRETLVSGRLHDVVDEIEQARSRLAHDAGWVMDVYLLRRA